MPFAQNNINIQHPAKINIKQLRTQEAVELHEE
jgi:hypothetical protein